MNKTIGILAHVDAGKTTFSEQLLYHTNRIKHRGRVDHHNAFLDSHEIERQRGITVFADQAMLNYHNSTFYLIDTPGHIDFSPEMERSMQVMDYAIVLISAVEGIQAHTETVWELLRKYQIPTFFFINKTDRVGANIEKIIESIRDNLTDAVVEITDSFIEGEMGESLIEFVAERNEELLDRYVESGYEKKRWQEAFIEMIKQNQVFPCAWGSALQDIGIVNFLDAFNKLTTTNYSIKEAFTGRVYKVRHDENGTRITYIKAISGTLKVRDEITYGEITEKITQMRIYNGNKYTSVSKVEAGELFAVTGLSMATVGTGIGCSLDAEFGEMIPTLKSKVLIKSAINMKEALRYFNILNAEDPSLNVIWDESLQQIHIHVMGTIQLEVLQQMILERFQLEVAFNDPEILYKETIESKVIGYGHFEPLGHYAEVHLRIEPGERNTGITFNNACHADDLSIGHQHLIQQHLLEQDHHGLLTGSPLTDVKITLLTGQAHNKHTSGGDFREATYRALRQGLEKAANLVLEPIYEFKIIVDLELIGRVMSDIQASFGKFDPPNTVGERAIITGTVPVATFMNYSTQLAAFTKGKGSIRLAFAGYNHCHNQKEVIEQIDYDKNADPKYTSTSIFCSKGQGYPVPWDEAEKEMHCSKK
ncbi:small GTP-binding protein [Cytobacillus eiseniae]|uniref:Small GTP-binding protein n=1 Tax=Cytobacillus eiseniae TaxID=762947 RepID=A0ABS4RAA6_9BACI|nr:TetM/TetW/TetO/TetS family tetracycline resistance ribosomal protection protein [Cytobacillus eiseniae]MBP2239833.1 small GTP-binding protein [Cytobacillus eiseniae]